MKLLSRVRLLETPWAAAYKAPPSKGFSRQEYWSGVPLPSPRQMPRPTNSESLRPGPGNLHLKMPQGTLMCNLRTTGLLLRPGRGLEIIWPIAIQVNMSSLHRTTHPSTEWKNASCRRDVQKETNSKMHPQYYIFSLFFCIGKGNVCKWMRSECLNFFQVFSPRVEKVLSREDKRTEGVSILCPAPLHLFLKNRSWNKH